MYNAVTSPSTVGFVANITSLIFPSLTLSTKESRLSSSTLFH